MKYHISHMTRYEYDAPLTGECFMEARLRPLTVPGKQICRSYTITVDPPVPVFGYDQLHQMGLVNHFVVRGEPYQTLSIGAESDVETLKSNPFETLNLQTSRCTKNTPNISRRRLWCRFLEHGAVLSRCQASWITGRHSRMRFALSLTMCRVPPIF